MISVSNSYKSAMKQTIRNRGYIQVDLDLVNEEIQSHGSIDSTITCHDHETDDLQGTIIQHFWKPTKFTTQTNLFKRISPNIIYTYLDNSTIKVAADNEDCYIFPPTINQDPPPGQILETAFTRQYINLSASGEHMFEYQPFEIRSNYADDEYSEPYDHLIDCGGLTVDWGDNYPQQVRIRMIYDDHVGDYEYFDLNSRKFIYDHAIEGVRSIELGGKNRKIDDRYSAWRIYSIIFGLEMTYTNKEVMSSDLDYKASITGETLPQGDFNVTIENYDRKFDIEDPKSPVHRLQTGQQLRVRYGYDTGETLEGILGAEPIIEWVNGGTLECSSWSLTDRALTLNAQDVLRNLDEPYYKGNTHTFNATDTTIPSPRSLKTMLDEMLLDKDITPGLVMVDEGLANIATRNPIPNVSVKEALQMIANAAGYELTLTRNGKIKMGPPPVISNGMGSAELVLERHEVMEHPETIKDEQIKTIEVGYSYFHGVDTLENLYEEEKETIAGRREVITFNEPVCIQAQDISSSHAGGAYLSEFGTYYAVIEYLYTGIQKITLTGQRWKKVDKIVTRNINTRGKTITWKNPLVDTEEKAEMLADRLEAYYTNPINYSMDYRGNPEIEVLDVIGQENHLNQRVLTRVESSTLSFDTSFRGHLNTRRLGYVEDIPVPPEPEESEEGEENGTD